VPVGRWLTAVLVLMAILLLVTLFNRVGGALQELRK